MLEGKGEWWDLLGCGETTAMMGRVRLAGDRKWVQIGLSGVSTSGDFHQMPADGPDKVITAWFRQFAKIKGVEQLPDKELYGYCGCGIDKQIRNPALRPSSLQVKDFAGVSWGQTGKERSERP